MPRPRAKKAGKLRLCMLYLPRSLKDAAIAAAGGRLTEWTTCVLDTFHSKLQREPDAEYPDPGRGTATLSLELRADLAAWLIQRGLSRTIRAAFADAVGFMPRKEG